MVVFLSIPFLPQSHHHRPRHEVERRHSISRGLTDRDIAQQLGIRQDTVNDHVSSILEKLNAANRTEAVSIAMRKHLLE